MANPRQIVALNVGSQRVSMGVFSKTPKDALVLERYATKSILLDPAEEGARLSVTGAAISELVQELGVKGSVINYSVSGQSVFIRFVKLPAIEGTDVEQLIRYEAQQHVPFPLDEVVWDYHLLPPDGLEQEAVLVAIKADELDTLNAEVTSHGLQTGKVDCALTSLYNAFADSYPAETEPVMLIDIGAKSTDIIYSEQGRFFTRSIASGGVFVTAAIARELGVPFKQAEELKLSCGMVAGTNVQMDGMDPGTVNMANIIRTAMTRLASEIQRTTNHYRAQIKGNAPVRAYICGGGALLPYTKEFLEDKLGLPIAFFNPLHNVSVGAGVNVEKIQTEACLLGGLVGSAINAAGKASLQIDLEPTAIASQRANSRKMPAIITGAAVAVLGAAIYAVTGLMGLNQANDTLAKLKQPSATLKKQEAALTENRSKLEALDSTVKSYQMLTLQRYGYAELFKRMLEETQHKDYPYWFTEFNPVSHFEPEEKNKITGNDIIKDTFASDKGTSIIDDAKPNHDDEDYIYSANAIHLTGYVLKKVGSDAGDKLVQALQEKIKNNPDSLFTYKDMSSQQIIERGSKDSKSDAATGAFTPFKLVLPLKKPIPVNFAK